MSAAGPTESIPPSPSAAKHKKSKKKKSATKNRANGDESKTNGTKREPDEVPEEDEPDPSATGDASEPDKLVVEIDGTQDEEKSEADQKDASDNAGVEASADNTEARLDALVQEREALRDEVATLRKSLEAFQGQNESHESLEQELEETRKEKEEWESRYHKLVGRVDTIKRQLGERLKSDAEELSQARSRIDDLEEHNSSLKTENEAREEEVARIAQEGEERSKELSSLRNRLNLSQQNWVKEREELVERESFAKEEFESAKQAMQDWEILAMDERSIRENLADKVAELEEQVTSHREAHERLESERQSQSLTVDGLQRALQEIQDARKKELREVVENSQSQLSELRKQLEAAEEKAAQSNESQRKAQEELERVQPFEVEVKEKNLLIGKLRHEAVILNDHLTKALKRIKKEKPEDTIDRQLVTNHLLHFLSIERSDPRKFQVLQIIASLLEWSDEQREQAGLSRPGASNVNLRTPISPWHRTPSTPSLSADYLGDGKKQESLGGLFSEFLEKESEDGKSRATSVSGSNKPSN